VRLFIAIGLPPEAISALTRVRESLEPAAGPGSPLRWSSPEGWHVTLQFLGSVPGDRLPCVLDHLNAIRAVPVPVRIEGLGFFERAGIFWAGVSLAPELLALQQFVTAAMRNCGFVPENRAYSPHITLARTKGRSCSKALAPLKKALEKSTQKSGTVRVAFTAPEFLLYESVPGPEGSRYEIRERFALTPQPATRTP
jgi:RNA 2',3'-cyclic 3'-phosphodiesterase